MGKPTFLNVFIVKSCVSVGVHILYKDVISKHMYLDVVGYRISGPFI